MATNPYKRGAMLRDALLRDRNSAVIYAKEALHHSGIHQN